MPSIETIQKHFKEKILPLAIEEDIGSGDITTDAIVTKGITATAYIKAKEDLVLCGIPFALDVFHYKNDQIKEVTCFFKDGDKVKRGEKVIEIKADLAVLLKYERTALNLLQRLSGIASKTASYVKCLEGSKTKLLDTRKTIPVYRQIEKYAVLMGGGTNHRIGLFDMFLIKDNHIEAAGTITEAIKRVRTLNQKLTKKALIEVECKTLEQIQEALNSSADIIMLDNMDDLKVKKAIDLIGHKAKIEVSGNITKGRLANLARLNIDYISSGALTHSVIARDLSMTIKLN